MEYNYEELFKSTETVMVCGYKHKIRIIIERYQDKIHGEIRGLDYAFTLNTSEEVETNLNDQINSIRYWLTHDYKDAMQTLQEAM
jgi:hypothetical protein